MEALPAGMRGIMKVKQFGVVSVSGLKVGVNIAPSY